MYKWIFSIYASIFFMLNGCEQKTNTYDVEHKTKPALRVGTIYSAATYLIINEQTGASGFDYDLARKFAHFIDAELDIRVYDNLGEMFQALEEHEIDLIAAGVTTTLARAKNFIFSPPLYQVKEQLVYKMNVTKWPRNFSHVKEGLVVVSQSSHVENLTKYKNKNPKKPRDIEWTETNNHSSEELLSMIIQEKIKYTIADSTTLAINRRYTPELGIGFTVTPAQDVAWVLSKENSNILLSQLLDFWKKEKAIGTFELLNEKYFGHIKKFDFVDTRSFIRATKKILPRFKSLFKRYSGAMDWRKIAATSYQESHWNPRAISPTGVRGMMMLTKVTAKQMKIKDRLSVAQSIRGGSKYLNMLVKKIPDSVPEHERMWFALASYNIGFGHVMDARKLARKLGYNPNAWRDLKKVLPLLHEKRYFRKTKYGYARGKEAVHYVDNIRRYYDTLVWIDTQHTNNLSTNEMIKQYESEHPETTTAALKQMFWDLFTSHSETSTAETKPITQMTQTSQKMQ
jgi:membrane-bound lytic murein transglycosylase F